MPDPTCEPSYILRRRAWDMAWALCETFSTRLTLDQAIRMEIIRRREPERLGWPEIADAIGTWCQRVDRRQ